MCVCNERSGTVTHTLRGTRFTVVTVHRAGELTNRSRKIFKESLHRAVERKKISSFHTHNFSSSHSLFFFSFPKISVKKSTLNFLNNFFLHLSKISITSTVNWFILNFIWDQFCFGWIGVRTKKNKAHAVQAVMWRFFLWF